MSTGYLLVPAYVVGTLAALLVATHHLFGRQLRRWVYEVPNSKKGDNESGIYRNVLAKDGVVDSPDPEKVRTLRDVLVKAVAKYGDRKCMGSRSIVRVHEEEKDQKKTVAGKEVVEKKKWRFYELGPYSWVSYNQVAEIAIQIGRGLAHLGCKRPQQERVAIYAATSIDWMLFAHGAFTQALTIVTAYDTLGEEGLLHSLQECEITHIFTNSELLGMLAKIASRTKLTHVIYNGERPAAAVLDSLAAANLKVVTFSDLRDLGKSAGDSIPIVDPKPEELACVMYTSGSTGAPKGVMLSHGNLVAAVGGARLSLLEDVFAYYEKHEGAYLAYLPLAHVLEFVVELTLTWIGVPMGYGSPRTLTDASVRNCRGDILELRPTVMTGVPAVWEGIRKGVLTKMKSFSATQKYLFNLAFDLKWWALTNPSPVTDLLISLTDLVVFNKLKAHVGGRLQYVLSGGAPISEETQKFITVALCPAVQGYGLTETCGMCSILTPSGFELNVVGAPMACSEMKLVDVPDAGYSHRDFPHPRGEVWTRGPSVSRGYYRNQALTNESFFSEGWFATGDIAEFNSIGNLRIIDRKKNLVKLQHGEYIALEKVESILKSSVFVNQLMVYADPSKDYCVAVVVPAEKEVLHFAEQKGFASRDLEVLRNQKEVVAEVLKSMRDTGTRGGLKPVELVQSVYLAGEEWTPDNGILTAAMKLKRKECAQKYSKEIAAMYTKSE